MDTVTETLNRLAKSWHLQSGLNFVLFRQNDQIGSKLSEQDAWFEFNLLKEMSETHAFTNTMYFYLSTNLRKNIFPYEIKFASEYMFYTTFEDILKAASAFVTHPNYTFYFENCGSYGRKYSEKPYFKVIFKEMEKL